jgi:hypothetical protein
MRAIRSVTRCTSLDRERHRDLVGWAGSRLRAEALSADKLFFFAFDSGHKSHSSHKFTLDVETGQSNLGCGKLWLRVA